MWTGLTKPAALIQRHLVLFSSALSALGGAAVGATVAAKHFEKKYALISEQEIDDAKLFYARLHKKDEFSEPITALEAYGHKVEELGYTVSEEVMEVPVRETSAEFLERVDEALEVVEEANEEVKSIFEGGTEEFDFDREVPNRSEERAYIITSEEFFENEYDHEQSNVTFFEGDDVLLDSREKPIPDPDKFVGDDNLLKFGYGSGDPNVVYVRNERLKMDFEVLRSKGKYTEEVLGFLQHSSTKNRKFRGFDE